MDEFDGTDLTFLLGSQRSGTTWLGDILDSHEDVFYFNEPFEKGLGLFDSIPGDAVHIEPSDTQFASRLDAGLSKLLAYKSILPHVLSRHRSVQIVESVAANLLFDILGRFRLPYEWLRRYRALNQRQEEAYRNRCRDKSPTIRRLVIKETRMASKIDALLTVLPDARFVYILRHPAGVVNSCLEWFARGRLQELRGYLDSYVSTMREQPFYGPYEDLLTRYENATLHERAALYWRINNEILFERLSPLERCTFVAYEDLCVRTLVRSEEIFSHLGLDLSPRARAFVIQSSTHEPINRGIVDTTRLSSVEFKAWQGRIDPAVRRDVERVTADSPLMTVLARYYD